MKRKCIWIFLLLLSYRAQAQTTKQAEQKIALYNFMLQQGTLKEKAYLDSLDQWNDALPAQGISFDKNVLIARLGTYRKIAWSGKTFGQYRIRYFAHLARNAEALGKGGEAIYFYEKMEAEIERETGRKSIEVLGTICLYYLQYENYPKIIQHYESEKGYALLNSYPGQIRKGSLDVNTASGYINVLLPVIEAYARSGDTGAVERNLKLAESIRDASLEQLSHDPYKASRARFALSDLYYHKFRHLLQDAPKAIAILKEAQAYLAADTIQDSFMLEIEQQFNTRFLAETFLSAGQYDSARYYLDKLEAFPSGSSDGDEKRYSYQAELLMHQGKYKEAAELLHKARMIDKEFERDLMQEFDELLYAHTESEWNREELKKAEARKRQNTILLIVVSAAGLGIITAIYILMRQEKKRNKKRIQALNEITLIQIEESRQQAAGAAQEQLGQDLHDELSATLAALAHNLGHMEQSAPEQVMEKLPAFREQISGLYEQVRHKSHSLFHNSRGLEQQLEKSIRKIVNSALTGGDFRNEFDIDPELAATLDLEQRIEILRIIQEAFTNTVKHSKASETFVFLFRKDDATAVLELGDNGKGFDPARLKAGSSGMGLQSIAKRVENLKGKLYIDNEAGATLIITFPCTEKTDDNAIQTRRL